MAARDPYSIAAGDLPHIPADGGQTVLAVGMRRDARIPLAAILAGTGAVSALLLAPAMGAVAASLLSAGAVCGLSVFSAAICGNDGATPAGAIVSCIGEFVSGFSMTTAASSLMAVASARGEATVGIALTLAAAAAVALTCGCRAKRMRDTLWQDVSWGALDGIAHRLLIRPAWEIAHIGDALSDRYAVISGSYFDVRSKAPDHRVRRRFLVDLRDGLLAPIGTGEAGDARIRELREQGYRVEEVSDASGRLVRSRSYEGDDGSFRGCPPREITASEYYHRLF